MARILRRAPEATHTERGSDSSLTFSRTQHDFTRHLRARRPQAGAGVEHPDQPRPDGPNANNFNFTGYE